MGLFNLFKSTKTVLVVDGVSLNESMGMKGKVPPRNQLQTLRRLARFAQREKICMVVVLSGSPLNKAPAGKKFEDITILYSKSIEKHVGFLVKTAKSKGAGAVLVSGNAAAEKLVGNSVQKLRVSTFRKAFDFGGDSEGSERSGGNSGRNRSQRRRQPKAQADQKPAAESRSGRKASSNDDAINELIDLVD